MELVKQATWSSTAVELFFYRDTGIVVYSGEHTLPMADRIWALPLSGLWR